MTLWQAQVDFGVVHPLIYPECRDGAGPVLETLQQIADDPIFGAVEIAPIRNPALREQVRALLNESAMQIVYLPILPIIFEDLGIGSADASKRTAAMARLRALIDEAVEFGAPLAMVTGPRDPGPSQREAATARLVEDLRKLCDYADARARQRRLHLTFEHFDRDVEKKRLIGPTVEAVALAEAIDRENFGLTVDLSHLPLLRETPAEALSAAGRYAIHAHIGNCVVANPDCPFYGDFHPRFGQPEGCNDVPEVVVYLRALDAIGFWEQARARLGTIPILSMELKANLIDQERPATLLANGKRTFLRAWARAGLSPR